MVEASLRYLNSLPTYAIFLSSAVTKSIMAPRMPLLPFGSRNCAFHRSRTSRVAFYATHIASPAAPIDAPEHPKFVDIPTPPQERASYIPEVKGTLPVPRQLFLPKGPNKTSLDYLAAVTKEPRHQPGITRSEVTQWKARAAELRRKYLREGLVELRRRKESIDKTVGARSARRQALYEEAVHRPEREDERLTTPTLPRSIKSGFLLNVANSQRKEDIKLREANAKVHKKRRDEEVRADLQSLYMNARTFVVNEKDLDDLVEDVFEGNLLSKFPEKGIWDKGYDVPDTVSSLLNSSKSRQQAVRGARSATEAAFARRVTQIAEELTGGKL